MLVGRDRGNLARIRVLMGYLAPTVFPIVILLMVGVPHELALDVSLMARDGKPLPAAVPVDVNPHTAIAPVVVADDPTLPDGCRGDGDASEHTLVVIVPVMNRHVECHRPRTLLTSGTNGPTELLSVFVCHKIGARG